MRLSDLMADLLSAGQDPRVALAGMPELTFSPRLPDSPEVPRSDLAPVTTGSLTVAEYYHRWVASKVYPEVRRAQERDYRRHIEAYVLPRIGGLPVANLTATELCEVRDALLRGGGKGGSALSRKYVRNILGASFRAMVAAVLDDGLLSVSPFSSQRWRRWPDVFAEEGAEPEADPFTPDERDRILAWFRGKTYGVHGRRRSHLPFTAWVAIQFLGGMSPSEASGLQWRDVGLDRGFVLVRRSYHLGRYAAPKTKRRKRTVEVPPEVISLLRQIMPLFVKPEDPVCTSTNGGPIEPKSFSHWYDCQRALGIRVRGAYCMKDTFVSLALMTPGINVQWVERHTGVALETLKEHYASWYPSAGRSELAKIGAFEKDPGITPTLTPNEESRDREGDEKAARSQ